MVGALGVWTPREAHQSRARDDLIGPLPFVTGGKQRTFWYTWKIENGTRVQFSKYYHHFDHFFQNCNDKRILHITEG